MCKSCHNPLSSTYFFCPYCGRKVKEPPPSTSFGKQLGLYLFAVLVPPFGLIPGIKYMNQPDDKSKVIGLITILLTAFSLMAAIYYGVIFWQYFVNLLNSQGYTIGLGI